MSRVIIRKADYEYSSLRKTVFEILDALSRNSFKRGMYVVVKPNLLSPASPEKAILTHPLMVRATVEYLLDRGCRVQVSDSPAVGSFSRILRVGGFVDSLKGLDVVFKEFKESVRVDTGKPFGMIEIAKDVIEADAVVNIPKLKTHSQMLLTLGVKNTFGCIVGMRKPEWHLRAGIDRWAFARLLVEVCRVVSPTVTLLDGILAMQGQGPGKGGTPRYLGILMGSDDPFSLDSVVCRCLRVPEERLFTTKVARQLGYLDGNVEIDGKLPGVKDFELPEMYSLVFGPKVFHGFLRRHLTQRPEVNRELCSLCGNCWEYCPAEAVESDNRKVHFDYHRCIRCYCCIEVCPSGAIKAKEPLMGKVLKKVSRRTK
jgi:uncharacterized protein (DUF362 family)/Pyruvate/2-oxoacid:ferredoxin oxidoreductase delta subunit